MISRRTFIIFVGLGLTFGTAAFFTRDTWQSWFWPQETAAAPAEKKHGHGHGDFRLSPQAQKNLRLISKPLVVTTTWRSIQLPGMIVDRPGFSDRGIVAPVTGVVTKVHAFPGDSVRHGDLLFTLRLLSETLHGTQAELFRKTKETQITEDQKKRLTELYQSGALPLARMIDVDNQLQRLAVAVQASRQELLSRGLTPEQINQAAEGKFVTEIQIVTPPRRTKPAKDPTFEVQELKVELGQQVQAGQTMCLLSDHQLLYIEGRGFRQETPLVERAIREAWPVHVEFMEEEGVWPDLKQSLTIHHLANTIDPASRTFAFFVPLQNQSETYEKDGKTWLHWRYRPGQRVRLHLPVEKFDNVFVLPADAVVREGPEAFVFRQNGDLFDRKPVHVIYQDRQRVVIANDGSIPPGLFVAQSGAAQLNRVLKGQGDTPAGFHVHADGSVHGNH
jgi:biotin carboxyl carrier protein